VAAVPDRLLLQMEWRVLRRLDGRVQGAYRTAYRGSGMDFAGLRGYLEEDDARHIDWNATARMNEPQVRQFTEERDLTVWLVLDRSASMTVGTPGRGKQDVLGELALSLARLFSRGGNRVGAILYGGPAMRVVPSGTGRGHALRIGYELNRVAELPPAPGTTDFAAMLDTVSSLARRRSLIIVISDFIGTGEWDKPLLRLTHRHEVVVLRVVDAADDDLPDAGLIYLEDAETGEQFLVDSSDPLFRARLADGVQEREADLTGRMRRAGVPLHRIGTDRNLVEALVDVVASTWWRRA
jgi:uncharacterized protein (DUF58 family)